MSEPAELSPIAVALREAMEARGITVPDLAQDLVWPAQTLYRIHSSTKKTMIRQRDLRSALDEYFGAAPGTTLQICQGKGGRYPTERLNELSLLAQPLPDEAVEHLVGFLRSLRPA